MRTFFNKMLVLLAATSILLPVAGATTPGRASTSTKAQHGSREPAAPMVQVGSFSTVVDAQEITFPKMAKLDGVYVSDKIVLASAPALVGGTNVVPRAPAGSSSPIEQVIREHRSPESSTGSAILATLLLLAFFIFRRVQ